MPDLSADHRVLLGTVGWDRADWLTGYYPADLPPEWRLSYYANDCDCVLVPHARWAQPDAGGWVETLAETPPGLQLFFEAPPAGQAPCRPDPEQLAGHHAVLLAGHRDPGLTGMPLWQAEGEGVWTDSRRRARLVRWWIDRFDLRELRARAGTLGAAGAGVSVVLDGPGADPGRVPELRTLLQLIGRA